MAALHGAGKAMLEAGTAGCLPFGAGKGPCQQLFWGW